MSQIRTMRLKIAAPYEFEGKTPPTNATDLVSITPLVLKQFGFLPQPVMVTVEGDEVVIQYPIRIQEENFESKIGATIQMAWKHKRDFHLVKIRADYPPPLVNHLESRELSHLKLESEARKAGENLFFATTAKTRDTAIQSVSGDIRKWDKEGHFSG
jgi:hypothetical protein